LQPLQEASRHHALLSFEFWVYSPFFLAQNSLEFEKDIEQVLP
jgi:hypothetical protein